MQQHVCVSGRLLRPLQVPRPLCLCVTAVLRWIWPRSRADVGTRRADAQQACTQQASCSPASIWLCHVQMAHVSVSIWGHLLSTLIAMPQCAASQHPLQAIAQPAERLAQPSSADEHRFAASLGPACAYDTSSAHLGLAAVEALTPGQGRRRSCPTRYLSWPAPAAPLAACWPRLLPLPALSQQTNILRVSTPSVPDCGTRQCGELGDEPARHCTLQRLLAARGWRSGSTATHLLRCELTRAALGQRQGVGGQVCMLLPCCTSR